MAAIPVDPSSLFYPMGVNAGLVFGVRSNPAALSGAKGICVGGLVENPFAVSEWMNSGLSGIWGHRNSGLALDYYQKGPAFYREQELGLAYGQGFGNVFRAGLRMKCRRTSIPDADRQYFDLAYDFGIRARFSKKLTFSAVSKEPFRIQGAEVRSVSSSIELGVQYEPDPNWALSIEFSKPAALFPSLGLGIGIRPSAYSIAWLRFFSNPWKFELGWGIEWGKMQIYSFAGYHSVLGVSPGLAVFRSF